jgi:hypothetical protein
MLQEELSLNVPCSWAQEEIVAAHVLRGDELGILESERFYLITKVQEKLPGKKIKSVNLNVDTFSWEVKIA